MLFCVWTVSRPRPDDEIEEFGESSDDLTMVRGSAAYGAGVACWSQDVSRRIAGFLRLACRTCRGKCLKTTKMRLPRVQQPLQPLSRRLGRAAVADVVFVFSSFAGLRGGLNFPSE